MARMEDSPNGKHYYTMWQTMFEIDTKYAPIRPIGSGAYGVVCSAINQETNEKVAIKKISNVFDNRVDALRTLRELRLLRHLRHENVLCLKDIMMSIHRRSFKDVYLVSELMDFDLHQIIKSSQPLSNDHCRYFLFQVSVSSVFLSYPTACSTVLFTILSLVSSVIPRALFGSHCYGLLGIIIPGLYTVFFPLGTNQSRSDFYRRHQSYAQLQLDIQSINS
jgi:mitogen-activated protein kinase 1/3